MLLKLKIASCKFLQISEVFLVWVIWFKILKLLTSFKYSIQYFGNHFCMHDQSIKIDRFVFCVLYVNASQNLGYRTMQPIKCLEKSNGDIAPVFQCILFALHHSKQNTFSKCMIYLRLKLLSYFRFQSQNLNSWFC